MFVWFFVATIPILVTLTCHYLQFNLFRVLIATDLSWCAVCAMRARTIFWQNGRRILPVGFLYVGADLTLTFSVSVFTFNKRMGTERIADATKQCVSCNSEAPFWVQSPCDAALCCLVMLLARNTCFFHMVMFRSDTAFAFTIATQHTVFVLRRRDWFSQSIIASTLTIMCCCPHLLKNAGPVLKTRTRTTQARRSAQPATLASQQTSKPARLRVSQSRKVVICCRHA